MFKATQTIWFAKIGFVFAVLMVKATRKQRSIVGVYMHACVRVAWVNDRKHEQNDGDLPISPHLPNPATALVY